MLLILAITGMFIAECIYGLNRGDPNASLLEVSFDTLVKFGATNGRLIRNGEVYRLISSPFVHLTFLHYIGNIFATFVLMTRI